MIINKNIIKVPKFHIRDTYIESNNNDTLELFARLVNESLIYNGVIIGKCLKSAQKKCKKQLKIAVLPCFLAKKGEKVPFFEVFF